MELQVGQMVRVKSDSPVRRFTGDGTLTVVRVGARGETVCVKAGERAGQHWVKVDDLEPVQGETREEQRV